MAKFWKLSHLKNKKEHIVTDENLQKLKANNHLRYYTTPIATEEPAISAEYIPEEVRSMEQLKKETTSNSKPPEMIIPEKKIIDPVSTDPSNKNQQPASKADNNKK